MSDGGTGQPSESDRLAGYVADLMRERETLRAEIVGLKSEAEAWRNRYEMVLTALLVEAAAFDELEETNRTIRSDAAAAHGLAARTIRHAAKAGL